MQYVDRRDFLRLGTAATTASLAETSSSVAEPIMDRKIRVAQIGVGHAHASKLSVYRDSQDYQVIGIAEPDESLWQAAGGRPVYQGLERRTVKDLIGDPSIDVILVETRVQDLLATAERCVAAGKHIHLDKPAGSDLDQFRRIVQQARASGRLIQMGYMYRYNPGVVMLRQFLEAGWLGDVFEVHAVMSKVVAPASRQRLAQFPGGIMFELGCHLLDLVVQVLGKPKRVSSVVKRVRPDLDSLNDNMLAMLEYDRAIATVKSSAVEVEGFARRHLVVCGTEGTLHIQPLDDPRVTLSLKQDRPGFRKGLQQVKLPKYTRYVDDAADMARILRGEKASDFLYDHDIHVQEVLLSACTINA